MNQLVVADPKKRLGCLKNGPADVKNLSWFSTVKWMDMEDKKAAAPRGKRRRD